MLFKFDIKQSEQDYLEYNIFHILKSPYGKKQVLSFRILLTLVIFIGVFFVLITDGFSARAFVDSIPLLLLLLIMQLTLKKFLILSLKGNIKRLKKAGKMPYSPESVIEVYDDKFVEITDTQRIEQSFSLVERVSVVDNKMVYIHVNSIIAFIIPRASFESNEQYHAFMDFLKTKCPEINFY